jgi:hypothetical protein
MPSRRFGWEVATELNEYIGYWGWIGLDHISSRLCPDGRLCACVRACVHPCSATQWVDYQ